ncbi:MAG TPA: hypothetical protein P5181_07180 [Dermatophilaceae bacterium]|nr:hypothetical protein [Dermatophilaceae bacterium]
MTGIEIERRTYGAHGLVRGYDPDGKPNPSWPELAAHAIRAICHLTRSHPAIPAPVLYEILGNLQDLGHQLPQALDQLSHGLARSLTEYDIYDEPGTDPHDNVSRVQAALDTAASHSRTLAGQLDTAQAAIARQGLRIPAELTRDT